MKCMAVTLKGELISPQEAQEVGYIA